MTQQRRYLLGLLLLAGFLFLYRLGERDLWDGTECEAANAARDMIDTGRIAVVHFFDQAFIDNRPPGFYWLVAASYKLTGLRGELGARLPAALAALALVVLTFHIGRRVADARAAFVAGLVLLGTFKFAWQGRLAESDVVLALFSTLACWSFWRVLEEPDGVLRHVLAFHLFAGLGALVKGPMIVFTILGPLAAYVVLSWRWRDVKWLPLIAASPLAIGLSLGWYAWIWTQWPEEREQLVARFTGQSQLHVNPFYYYALKAPAILGLVTLLVPLLVPGWRRASRELRRGALGFFITLVIVQFVAFSCFASKQTHYLVPALPPLAIALGMVVTSGRYEERRYLLFSGLALATLAPVAPLIWLFVAPEDFRPQEPLRAWVAFVVLAALATWAWTALRHGRRASAFTVSWVSAILATAVCLGDFLPRLDDRRSSRAFAERVAEVVPRGARLGATSFDDGLAFYVERPVEIVLPEAIDDFLEDAGNYLVVEDEVFARISRAAERVVDSYPHYRHRGHTAYLLAGGEDADADPDSHDAAPVTPSSPRRS